MKNDLLYQDMVLLTSIYGPALVQRKLDQVREDMMACDGDGIIPGDAVIPMPENRQYLRVRVQ